MDSQERFENMVGLVEAHQYEWAIWQAAERATAAPAPERADAEAIYQLRNASGAWTDISESFYRIINDGDPLFKTRIVYEVHLEGPVCNCAPNVTGEACEKCYGAAPMPERAQESSDEISSLRKRLADSLLDAERAREEQNREHVRLNAEWMAKCEELRKDAKRYRWLRQQNWNEADMAVVCHPKKSVKLGFDCPSGQRLDEAIDAAIKKEQDNGL